jgi:hypothetical protein
VKLGLVFQMDILDLNWFFEIALPENRPDSYIGFGLVFQGSGFSVYSFGIGLLQNKNRQDFNIRPAQNDPFLQGGIYHIFKYWLVRHLFPAML